jgi:hypothetical protein
MNTRRLLLSFMIALPLVLITYLCNRISPIIFLSEKWRYVPAGGRTTGGWLAALWASNTRIGCVNNDVGVHACMCMPPMRMMMMIGRDP